MRRAAPKLILSIAVAALIPALIAFRISPAVHDRLTAAMPECPHNWDALEVSKSKKDNQPTMTFTIGPSGLSVSGSITNVPEFHDCQRMVLRNGNYGPLMAVFAARDLASIKFNGASVTAAAEIFNDSTDFSYPPLGIGPLFNCLYVFGNSGALRAKMVNVGGQEKDCGKALDTAGMAGVELQVVESLRGRFQGGDFPPVARWDWDSSSRTQYIGLKCGQAWCEIGMRGFVTSTPYYDPPAGMTVLQGPDRVRAIKGWYDQQYLANDPGLGTPSATPSDVKATFFPFWDLNKYRQSDFRGRWAPVSYIALSKPSRLYKTKFNLDAVRDGSELKAMNVLSLCIGTIEQCRIPAALPNPLMESCGKTVLGKARQNPRWWVQITSVDGSSIYRCVTYRGHETEPPPPTARWRWLAKDETEWQYCPRGCCEVEVGGIS
jgi:hypothetical protein